MFTSFALSIVDQNLFHRKEGVVIEKEHKGELLGYGNIVIS